MHCSVVCVMCQISHGISHKIRLHALYLLEMVEWESFFCVVHYEILVALVVRNKSRDLNSCVTSLEKFTIDKEI